MHPSLYVFPEGITNPALLRKHTYYIDCGQFVKEPSDLAVKVVFDDEDCRHKEWFYICDFKVRDVRLSYCQ